jgi:hypothetical protein
LPLNKVWYFNSSKVNLTDNCQQKFLLAYSCNLHFDLDKESIIGGYILELTNSVYNVSKSIGFHLVLPNKPEVKILKPKYCSSFIACEFNKSIEFQCNIKAHSIDSFRMISLPCKNLNDCFFESSELMNLLNDQQSISNYSLIHNDKEHWNLNFNLHINQSYIVACMVANSFDKTFTSRIVLPSSISNGEIIELKMNNYRLTHDHIDVVEGDSFILKFRFLRQIFDQGSVKHHVISYSQNCIYEIIRNQTELVYLYSLSFKNITKACNSEYHFEVNGKNYSKLNNEIRSIKINVATAVAPVFKQINCSRHNSMTCKKDDAENVFKIELNNHETLKLDCRSTANPKAEVKWFFNDLEINIEDDRYFKSDDKQKLKIYSPLESDSGTYRCLIQNKVGSIERNFKVIINSKYQNFIIILSALSVVLSSALIIVCIISFLQKRKMDKLFVNMNFR